MSANTHVAASALRATDRLRAVGNLEVAEAITTDGRTLVSFTEANTALMVAEDTIVKVWRPFTPGDLVSWITREWVEEEPAEGDLEDDYGYREVVTVHKGRVNNVTISDETGHAVINVLTGYVGGSEPQYQDFTSRDLRHAVYTEADEEVTA